MGSSHCAGVGDGGRAGEAAVKARFGWTVFCLGWVVLFVISHTVHPSSRDVHVGFIGFVIGVTVMGLGFLAMAAIHDEEWTRKQVLQYDPEHVWCDRNFRRGWWCSAERGHDGPCALRPRWWYRLAVLARGRTMPRG